MMLNYMYILFYLFLLLIIYFCSFFEELHDFFSPILLINYIISSLLICMVGLQIVAVSTFSFATTQFSFISFSRSFNTPSPTSTNTLHYLLAKMIKYFMMIFYFLAFHLISFILLSAWHSYDTHTHTNRKK